MFVRPGTAHLGTFPFRFPNDYPDVKIKNTKLVKHIPDLLPPPLAHGLIDRGKCEYKLLLFVIRVSQVSFLPSEAIVTIATVPTWLPNTYGSGTIPTT